MLTNLVPERDQQTNSVLEQFLELAFKVSGSSLPADASPFDEVLNADVVENLASTIEAIELFEQGIES